jgi:hypothetical protein|tara:strand:- start:471 stop:713 length:243 start_codon:yes stop_codon:yes gene_type:complete
MNTPFKMKGFSGFGNSPAKQDKKKTKKFKADDVFYTKPNTMDGTTKRTVRKYEYMQNPKTGKYGYKFSTGEFINEDDIEN